MIRSKLKFELKIFIMWFCISLIHKPKSIVILILIHAHSHVLSEASTHHVLLVVEAHLLLLLLHSHAHLPTHRIHLSIEATAAHIHIVHVVHLTHSTKLIHWHTLSHSHVHSSIHLLLSHHHHLLLLLHWVHSHSHAHHHVLAIHLLLKHPGVNGRFKSTATCIIVLLPLVSTVAIAPEVTHVLARSLEQIGLLRWIYCRLILCILLLLLKVRWGNIK